MTESLPKVMISLPSTGTVRTETTVALAKMIGTTGGIAFSFDNPVSCYIHESREQSAKKAIVMGADYLMFIDSDVVFPPDGLQTLIANSVDFVGANYNMHTKIKVSAVVASNDERYRYREGDSPFKCRAVPAGFFLLKVDALKKVKRPWFFFRDNTHPKGMIGEDVWFCDQAIASGFDIWCDPTIHIDHIGIGVF